MLSGLAVDLLSLSGVSIDEDEAGLKGAAMAVLVLL